MTFKKVVFKRDMNFDYIFNPNLKKMALKLKKYPRKPKASASADTLSNYLKKCATIDKENNARKSEHKKKEALAKRVRELKPKK